MQFLISNLKAGFIGILKKSAPESKGVEMEETEMFLFPKITNKQTNKKATIPYKLEGDPSNFRNFICTQLQGNMH